MDIRVESHGDGLRFLDGLTDGAVKWNEGSADLRFLIRGTIIEPEANGFLVIRKGGFVVMEKEVRDLDSLMIFDFNRVEFFFRGTARRRKININPIQLVLYQEIDLIKDNI